MKIKTELDKAQRDMEQAAQQNRQPDPGTPTKAGFPFDLQTRKPTGGNSISGSVSTSKP